LHDRIFTDPLAGVCCVLATPFDDNGALDERSLERLVEHVIGEGVDSVACLGLASEAYKLDDAERRRVIVRVVEATAGRVAVVAGADHTGGEAAAARVAEAADLGVSAVMAYPPTFVKPDATGVVDYYLGLARAAPIPIIVQDAPAWTGIPLPVALLVSLQEAAPTICYVKVEAPPAADKIAALTEAGLRVLGGYGALHLPEEARAGAVATMPGCALAALYRDVWGHIRAGEDESAWALHARALPLLSFQMSSLDVLIGVQKRLLAAAGVIATPKLRAPGVALSPRHVEWLDLLLARTGLDRYR
jgi:2-keto-3-deoxy-L-arabinonate dehydratase